MYETDRLATEVWVTAHLRQCDQQAIPAFVVHKGAEYSGAIILKINQLDKGCRVLSQVRDMDGNLCWMAAHDEDLIPETQADAYIKQEIATDPDVWVVEIESPDGKNPFEGKMLI